AWNSAYRGNHSTIFYSSIHQQEVAAQYDNWIALAAGQLAIIAKAYELASGDQTLLQPILDAHHALLCDNQQLTCRSGGHGTVAQFKPPALPDFTFVDTRDGLMWSGFSAFFDATNNVTYDG